MWLLILSFFAWVLTILAPCILPFLPVILWASVDDSKDKSKPYVIIASLMVSIIIFSILLKASTVLLWIDPIYWKLTSWIILILFWVVTIFPSVWHKVSWKLTSKSNEQLNKNSQKKWLTWNILLWASLWPVFSSCSPTYAVILAVILPANFFTWFINLVAYAIWLGVVLLIIAVLWQKFVTKVKFLSNPKWWFKKILWLIFVLVWIAIITWFDKTIETFIIESWYINLTNFEQSILDEVNK